MSWQRGILALCTIAAVAWMGLEAARFHQEEVVPKTGIYWVLTGKAHLVVGIYPAYVMIPPGLDWDDFNRAVDTRVSEKVSYFLLQWSELEYEDRWHTQEDNASSVAYHLRRSIRGELYRLYQQDERDDRAVAWNRALDRASWAFAPAAALLVFAGAMWWALAGFDAHDRSRSASIAFVKLWLVMSAVWMLSYAALAHPPEQQLRILTHGRRGPVPILLRAPRIDRIEDQDVAAWVVGLLIVPVVLGPLLAACESARRDRGKIVPEVP